MNCLLLLDESEIPEGLDELSVRILRVSSTVLKKLSGVRSVESIEAIALMRIPRNYVVLNEGDKDLNCRKWFPSMHRVLVLDGIQVLTTPTIISSDIIYSVAILNQFVPSVPPLQYVLDF